MSDNASTTTMQVIELSSKNYPAELKTIYNPPKELHIYGMLPAQPMVAIVGSRKPTPYGEMVGYRIASDLAKAGVCIVSGLAYGIDGIVHQAALEAGGTTVAVLGSGIDKLYPAAHKPLARQIVQTGGAIITEYPNGTPPLKHHFPARNRIIAGLSAATVVPEADAKSGSLITAQLALEENRIVCAVPGPITSARSAGPNNLLKAGAVATTSAADICSLLGIDTDTSTQKHPSTTELSQYAKDILTALQSGATTTEDLATSTKITVPALLSTLTLLEIQNYVRCSGGNLWMSTTEI